MSSKQSNSAARWLRVMHDYRWWRPYGRGDTAIVRLVRDKMRGGRQPSLLDVGCGDGYWSRLFAEDGCTVTAVDLKKANTWTARKDYRPHVSYITADALNMPFASSARFDCVSIFNLSFYGGPLITTAVGNDESKKRLRHVPFQHLVDGGQCIFLWNSDLSGKQRGSWYQLSVSQIRRFFLAWEDVESFELWVVCPAVTAVIGRFALTGAASGLITLAVRSRRLVFRLPVIVSGAFFPPLGRLLDSNFERIAVLCIVRKSNSLGEQR